MLCSNCGKNNANVHYTQIINGKKTEYSLCEDCAKKLGIEEMDFNMPINYSNFLSNFFEDDMLLPNFNKTSILKCPKCGLTFDNFVENGRFGCSECYEVFSDKLDSILKNLHGSNRHKGKIPQKTTTNNVDLSKEKKQNIEDKKQDNKLKKQIEDLNQKLQLAISEERYEDAAKLRDQIKNLNK